jgi:hypothetical protein
MQMLPLHSRLIREHNRASARQWQIGSAAP